MKIIIDLSDQELAQVKVAFSSFFKNSKISEEDFLIEKIKSYIEAVVDNSNERNLIEQAKIEANQSKLVLSKSIIIG